MQSTSSSRPRSDGGPWELGLVSYVTKTKPATLPGKRKRQLNLCSSQIMKVESYRQMSRGIPIWQEVYPCVKLMHVSFPAVTICNLNMIRNEKLPKNFIENLLAEVYGEESEELTEEDQRSEPPTPIPTFDAPTESEANSGTVEVTNACDNAASSSMNDGTAMATDGKAGGTTDSMGDISTVATLPTNEDTVTSSTEVPTRDTTTYPYNDDSSYDYHDNYDYNDDDDYDYNYDYNYDYDYDYYGFEGETKEKEFEIEETIRAELALKNDSTIIEMGHQFEDLVFECSFRGYDCRNYTKYWRQLWDYRHGNCYTFNGGITDDGENQRVLQSHITGPTGGLKLNLFIEQSQYIPELSHTAGARVVIHDQGQIPFPNNEGYSVLPSHSTSFAIRRSVIERADPFGNGSCISDKDLKRNNLYSRKFNASYSRQACLNSCQAEKQIEACGCAEGQFPSEADICNLRNDATAKCLETIQRKLVTGGLDCEKQCPTPCREVQYRTTLSMGYWPSDGYEDILASRINGNSALSKELEHGYYFLSENFLQVKVYYEQLNYEKVTERISYGGVYLVADIGGQLGLWIGISVLTCCEFLELAWMIIQTAFERLSRRNVIHVTA